MGKASPPFWTQGRESKSPPPSLPVVFGCGDGESTRVPGVSVSWILSCVIMNHSHMKHLKISSESHLQRGCRDRSGPAALLCWPGLVPLLLLGGIFPKRGQRPEHSFPWEGSGPLQACSQRQGSVVPVPSAAWLSPTPASLAGSSSVPPESCVAGEGRVGRSGGLIPSPPRAALPRGAVALTRLHHGGGAR